ncbi:TetR/AcrR family transcriptional regulator [Streptomyces aidingensis]|uniref:DNA-binding transcriptional regulator, AcrR family n=1 Tax=Streptomyces aidingensis TaxID=910347 RepID=A0A1I1UFA2_9ACTN|nr:TetR/AcrR family transcriptional regulator [Streptomyces aidingensis]SFD66640.1 DNA-binding transcriptional regulator, AcrR family [Streptomyces aidingensis]
MHTFSLRKVPVQQRSAERLDRILDTCARLLDETGYEALSTRGVAAAAGVPIGSVYRFFADKRQMVEALAHRNLQAYTARVRERLAALPDHGWRPALDVCFDAYVEMKRTVPGFTLIDFGVPDSRDDNGPNQRVAEQLYTLLREHLGGDGPGGRLGLACLVCVQSADALLGLAFRAGPGGDAALIDETRTLLRSYLAQVLD